MRTISGRTNGYDIHFHDPGILERDFCDVCGHQMDCERNVRTSRSMAGAMAGIKSLCDIFTCPHSGYAWHKQALDIHREIKDQVSHTIINLLKAEKFGIILNKIPTLPHKYQDGLENPITAALREDDQ